MDDFTARRLAAKEVPFRLLNERPSLAEFEDEEDREEPPVFVCECARDRCVEDLEMKLAEWKSVRERPNCFVVAPGHEIPAIEDVVERRPSYVVVKKRV